MFRKLRPLADRLKMLDTIRDTENHLDDLRHKYLRAAGWHHTSTTPDFRWKWRKRFDGVLYAVSRDDALHMQADYDASREPVRVRMTVPERENG